MSQSYFMTPNLKQKLLKVIVQILEGTCMRQNESRLNELRKKNEYPLTLCQLLADTVDLPLMSLTSLEEHKRSFIALEIKKHAHNLTNPQCWWLMRDIYLGSSDKIARLIRQACLNYKPQYNKNNQMYIFFCVDLENAGIVGLVRYLTFVYESIRHQVKDIQCQTLREYEQEIVMKLFEVLQWHISEYLYEFSLTCLVLLQGHLVGRECWRNTIEWNELLDKLCYEKKKPLISCLAKYLKNEINLTSTQSDQYQNSQILEAVKICLSKTKSTTTEIPVQKMFYLDCIQILGLYWTRSIRNIKDSQQFDSSYNMVMDIIQAYSHHLVIEQQDQRKINCFEQYLQQVDDIVMTKKLSFLKTILYLFPNQQLRNIIESRSSYPILILEFSWYMPCLISDGFVRVEEFQALLDNLYSALEQQKDTHLFVKDKTQFIWTLLRHIVRYRKMLDRQLILKICYVVDFLVYKCDTIAKEGFEILDLLTEEVLDLSSFELVEFLERTLLHINENEWLQSNTCYFHVINILVNLSPQFIFNSENQHSYTYQMSNLQREIIKMVNKMISILKQQFNFETLHKLNTLLQYIFQPEGIKLCKFIQKDDIEWVGMVNFRNQIYTDAFADVYFYCCQLPQNRLAFIQSLNLFKFWQNCESQRLEFFVKVYLKFINSEHKFFTSSQTQNMLIELKRNLWHRFACEKDEDQRKQIVKVFESNHRYLDQLRAEAIKALLWGENKNNMRHDEGRYGHFAREKMEIE